MPTKQYQIQLQGAATIGIIVLYSIPIRKVLHLGLPLRVFRLFSNENSRHFQQIDSQFIEIRTPNSSINYNHFTTQLFICTAFFSSQTDNLSNNRTNCQICIRILFDFINIS